MRKTIAIIRNSRRYPVASVYLKEMKDVFAEMEYDVYELDESHVLYEQGLQKLFDLSKTEMECKAVITCNAIDMDRISKKLDCLYITHLEGKVEEQKEVLLMATRNTAVFCSSEQMAEYLKANYTNIGEVLYANYACDENGRLRYEVESNARIMAETQMAFDIQELIAVRQGKGSVLKLLIQRTFESQDLQRVRGLMDQYRKECPDDLELFSMEVMYALYVGDFETALQYARKGVRKYPCNADLYYNLGNVYECMGQWFWAWVAYGRAFTIYDCSKDEKIKKLDLVNILENCRKKCEENPDGEVHAKCEDMQRNWFGLRESAFRNLNEQILGKYYWESETQKKYAGIYRDYCTRRWDMHADVVHTKGEFVEAIEGDEFEVPSGDGDVFLPVAVEEQNTKHRVVYEGKEYSIAQMYNRHFNYYRMPSGSKVYSSGKAYYGNPIPLVQKKDKKKLVLNIFVDGLAQCILDGEQFEKNMPNTARFFGKGTVCTRAYNTAEWTYPSIVNYVTGLDTTHHMLFHNMLDGSIPEECPTLAEYFQQKGYFTAKMCGNWRIIPTYGHARGYDQFIYQHQWQGFKAETIVGEVVDHIEAFKETNQFLWMSIGDLHDVADGIDMPNSVQSVLDVEECIEEEVGATSVKQGYSKIKKQKYEKMARRIDTLLNVIYRYLEETFKDEEILVSLFSDHGQGYLIPSGEHFCAQERSKVAFMFRGDNVEPQISDEVMSTSDYIKIMCKLADIEMKDVEIQGKLPKVFGGEGREYALTESIHPGDRYYAAIYAKDCVFYFENPFPVQDDGRFYIKEYTAKLTDMKGNELNDMQKYEMYKNIILDHIAPLCIYD